MDSMDGSFGFAMLEGTMPAQNGARKGKKSGEEGKFSHYRRSKTNKAPRKRTFIANMSKYTDLETHALESASRGVGVNAVGGQVPGGTSMAGDSMPTGGAAGAAHMQGAAAYYPGGAPPVAYPNNPNMFDNLPWGLASLPTLSDPVVWGVKELPGGAGANHQNPTDASFTHLLMGAAPSSHPAYHQQHHQHQATGDANIAAAVEAALAALAAQHSEVPATAAAYQLPGSGATGTSSMTLQEQQLSEALRAAPSWQQGMIQQQQQAAQASGPPKVSMDLFPELAALSGVATAGHMEGPAMQAVGVASMCHSRAVTTGMPSYMQVHGMDAAAAALAPATLQATASGPVAATAAAPAASLQLGARAQSTTPLTSAMVGLDLHAASPPSPAPSAAAPSPTLAPHPAPSAPTPAAAIAAASPMVQAVAAAPASLLQAQASASMLQASGPMPAMARAASAAPPHAHAMSPSLSSGSQQAGHSISTTGATTSESEANIAPSALQALPSGYYSAGMGRPTFSSSGTAGHSSSSSSGMASTSGTHVAALAALLQQQRQQQQMWMSQAGSALGAAHADHPMAQAAAAAAAAAAAVMMGRGGAAPQLPALAPAGSLEHQPLMVQGGFAQASQSPRGTAPAGRGTKRGRGAGAARPSSPVAPGSGLPVGAEVTPPHDATVSGPAAVGAAAGQPRGGVEGPRTPPFTLPLHGVSAAGAVVPGGAGKLRVNSVVSVGAYGVVYRGRWADSDVAVKMMRTPSPGEPLTASDVLRSFRHETALLKRLAHPNIVAVRHAQDVEPVCIVQDYATHGTLSTYVHAPVGPQAAMSPATDFERLVLRRLARRLAMSPDTLIANLEARSVASAVLLQAGSNSADHHANHRLLRRYVVLLCLLRDVASAFVYLAALPTEQQGSAGQPQQAVVHRDVKPTNILLSSQGTALLADFGVAKLVTLQPAAPLPPTSSGPLPLPQLTPATSTLAPASSAPLMARWPSSLQQPMGHHQVVAAAHMQQPLLDHSVFGGDGGAGGPADNLASWGLTEPLLKRARTVEGGAGGAGPTWDPLPSFDMDMGWLSALLDEDQKDAPAPAATAQITPAEARTSTTGSAPVAVPGAFSKGTALQLQSLGGGAASSSAYSGCTAVHAPSSSAAAAGSQQSAGGAAAAVAAGPGSPDVPHGTAHYAAPEDLVPGAHALTPAADMFSLGYCMWEALGGARPWATERSADVVAAVGRGGARLPLPDAWPRRMRALIGWCWAAAPAQRPTPQQVLAELDAEIRTALSA